MSFAESVDFTLNEGALNEDALRTVLADASRVKQTGAAVPRHIVSATRPTPNVVRLAFSFGFFTFPLTRIRHAK